MPKYTVIQDGFHGGMLYSPNGKRRTLTTAKPLDPVPSWLKPVKEATPAKVVEKTNRATSGVELTPAQKGAQTRAANAAAALVDDNKTPDVDFTKNEEPEKI